MRKLWFRLVAFVTLCAVLSIAGQASAWGDDGHRVIGLIAWHFIQVRGGPKVREEVQRLLSLPLDPPVPGDHGMGWASTWADKYRESSGGRRSATHNWHYVDLDIDGPDLGRACFGRLNAPSSATYLTDEANDCVVDKINHFAARLGDHSLSDDERAHALAFLLHFIGDVHQPLHGAEHANDAGGNQVPVVRGDNVWGTNLHSYWDTDTIHRLGSSPEAIAKDLIAGDDATNFAAWTGGSSADWAQESYVVAVNYAYRIGATQRDCKISKRSGGFTVEHCYVLDDTYAANAAGQARRRLQQAGARLAQTIINALQ